MNIAHLRRQSMELQVNPDQVAKANRARRWLCAVSVDKSAIRVVNRDDSPSPSSDIMRVEFVPTMRDLVPLERGLAYAFSSSAPFWKVRRLTEFVFHQVVADRQFCSEVLNRVVADCQSIPIGVSDTSKRDVKYMKLDVTPLRYRVSKFIFKCEQLLVNFHSTLPDHKLLQLCVAKQLVETCFYRAGIGINDATHFVAFLAVFFAAFIPIHSIAEPTSFPESQALEKQIDFDNGWIVTPRTWAFPIFEERGPERQGRFVEFLSFVPTEGKPVAQKQTQEKRDPAVQRNDNGVSKYFEKYGVHWLLIPLFWFLVGLICGGAFDKRR